MPKPYLPAEWYPQWGIILTWPHEQTDFKQDLVDLNLLYYDIVSVISEFQNVCILCYDPEHEYHLKTLLHELPQFGEKIHFVTTKTNDVWIRDYGPLTTFSGTQSGNMVFNLFHFNGWGNKYRHNEDQAAAKGLATYWQNNKLYPEVHIKEDAFILEGGSIDTDGNGTALVTSHCLLNQNRNGSMTKEEIEKKLSETLGLDRILWVSEGYLEGDDTDSHIDQLARFCNENTILHASCEDPDDPHFDALNRMAKQLASFTTKEGEPYNLVPLPIPSPIVSESGERLPASYINFLIINGAVLLPIYDDPLDDETLITLGHCFPGREIIPILCTPLIEQYGSLHCATMHVPKFANQ